MDRPSFTIKRAPDGGTAGPRAYHGTRATSYDMEYILIHWFVERGGIREGREGREGGGQGGGSVVPVMF